MAIKLHRPAPRAKPQNPIKVPKPGMILSIYMSHRKIGSGTRLFIVTSVGNRYVTLLVPADLATLRLSWPEWDALIAVRDATWEIPDFGGYAAAIEGREHLFKARNMKYQSDTVAKAIALLRDKDTMFSLMPVSEGDNAGISRGRRKR